MTEPELPKYLRREVLRSAVIQEAVKAAEAVLNKWVLDAEASPDEKSYLWYKVGGNLMMVGVESIDKRVFIGDLTSSKMMKLVPDEPKPVKDKTTYPDCNCGRQVIDENDFATFAAPVCSGCFNLPLECICVKLSKQVPTKK